MKKTIEISVETWEKIKDQVKEDEVKEIGSFDDMVGEKFFFRTVTYHQVGRVKKVIGKLLELEDASWVADSGRFTQAIKEGTLDEVEPVGKCYLNIDALIDVFPWVHNLPKDQK